jgi:Fe-S-cluster containining protein
VLDGRARGRAAEAGKRAIDLFEVSHANNPPEQAPACRRGCSFCCYGFVAATAPEIFFLARHINARGADEVAGIVARLREATAALAGLDKAARHRRRRPCAFLVDGECSVYAARPLACRAFASLSVERCKHAFEFGGEDIPVPAINLELRAGCYQALWSALNAAGLPSTTYELAEGVMFALATPDAEARWLDGENIFAGAAVDADAAQIGATPEAKLRFQVIGAAAMGREPPKNPWV